MSPQAENRNFCLLNQFQQEAKLTSPYLSEYIVVKFSDVVG